MEGRNWVGQIYYSSFSSMKDDQGRYVLITGYLYGEHIFIGCVYAPNVYQKEFYSDLLGKITNLSLPFSILGGDFNCTLNPEVNQFPSAKTTQSKMRETTIQLLVIKSISVSQLRSHLVMERTLHL
uniref:Endonuclease/exonuclease/phosphatase domain-containing protein n=1 Tax=Salarias fasciatus TaxID=181472 RepID=A0A672FX15_SALFA